MDVPLRPVRLMPKTLIKLPGRYPGRLSELHGEWFRAVEITHPTRTGRGPLADETAARQIDPERKF